MRSKCAWRGLSWKWFDQSAMGTLSCALSVPGVESVGSTMGTLSCTLGVPGVESVGRVPIVLPTEATPGSLRVHDRVPIAL